MKLVAIRSDGLEMWQRADGALTTPSLASDPWFSWEFFLKSVQAPHWTIV
jgi:hypothetical protein